MQVDGVLNPFDAFDLGYPDAQEALPSPLVGAGLYQPPKVPVAPLPTWQNPRPPPVALGGTSPVRRPPLRPGSPPSLGPSPATQPAPPPVFYPRPHAGVGASALQRVSKALLGVPSQGQKAAPPVGGSTQDEELLSQVMDRYGEPIFIRFDMPHYNEDDSGPHYMGH
ncbi:Protein of unknown function [Gryllus bimaculatus]|nr:Protein of unknown function [Gryllus bimaculatus]